jgi:hypothetical protein
VCTYARIGVWQRRIWHGLLLIFIQRADDGHDLVGALKGIDLD